LRVLHCIPSLLGGGAERQLGYIVEGLARRGVEVHVALVKEGPNAERVRRAGVTIHALPHPRAWDLRAVPRIAALARSLRANVIQTWLTRMDLWGGAAAQLARVPWVISERSSQGAHRPANADRARFALGRRAAAVAANSATAAAEWRARVPAGTPVVTIPNALPTDEIDATTPADRAQLGIPAAAPLILYAGRFAAPKNPAVLADALAAALRARPDAWALLCGEGPDLAGVRDVLTREGVLDRCVLPGYRDDLWRWMKSADVFVSLSVYEGRPNVVQEALRCGAPSVLTDIPAHREFIPDDAARYVGVTDRAGATRAVLSLLDDRESAAALAARGRGATAAITLDSVAEAYQSLYEEVRGRWVR
jgi:glycosyltransferase involved in cell wall biosynthesis